MERSVETWVLERVSSPASSPPPHKALGSSNVAPGHTPRSVSAREREEGGRRGRQRARQSARDREPAKERQRDSETDTDTERCRERERERERERDKREREIRER